MSDASYRAEETLSAYKIRDHALDIVLRHYKFRTYSADRKFQNEFPVVINLAVGVAEWLSTGQVPAQFSVAAVSDDGKKLAQLVGSGGDGAGAIGENCEQDRGGDQLGGVIDALDQGDSVFVGHVGDAPVEGGGTVATSAESDPTSQEL